MSKLLITETVLRDAHQSLAATRMTTNEMLPILDEMDKVGYYSLEAWGGATFDACLRFLNEDPWERLRKTVERGASCCGVMNVTRQDLRTCSGAGSYLSKRAICLLML